jgi:hypothetical protein
MHFDVPHFCDTFFRFYFLLPKGVRLERFIIHSGEFLIVELWADELDACHRSAEWDDGMTEVDVWQTGPGYSPSVPNRLPLRLRQLGVFEIPTVFLSNDGDAGVRRTLQNRLVGFPSGPQYRIECSFSSSFDPSGSQMRIGGALLHAEFRDWLHDSSYQMTMFQRQRGEVASQGRTELRLSLQVDELWIHWPVEKMGCSAARGVQSIEMVAQGITLDGTGPRGFETPHDSIIVLRLGMLMSRIDSFAINITPSPNLFTAQRKRAVDAAIRQIGVLRRWLANVSRSHTDARLPQRLPKFVERCILSHLLEGAKTNFPETLHNTAITRNLLTFAPNVRPYPAFV